MRTMRLFILFLFIAGTVLAQRGHGHGNGHGPRGRAHVHKKVVVKRSVYRPRKVVVFRPHWRPNYGYKRRWVFFPRYNIYWDNWRNHYVFWNGAIWISQPQAPPSVANVELDKEKQKELKEEEDDVDDVYKANEEHKKEIKA